MITRTAEPLNDPKQRLIKAGEELFAREGFHHATTREICRRANLNMAMISYYFGSKASLYRAVLEQSVSEPPPTSAAGEAHRAPCPEKRMEDFVAHALARSLDTSNSRAEQLIEQELANPTFALDIVIEKVMRPRADRGNAIVRDLVGPDVSDDQVRLIRQSIVAQCLHYKYDRHLIHRLYPGHTFGPQQAPELTRHITRFSLAGLLAFRGSTGVRRTDSGHGDRAEAEAPPADLLSSAYSPQPKVRLLEAAVSLFATVGYRHLTIRDICKRAEVNVAMVNYYFGGKKKLYLAVVEHACAQIAGQLRPRRSSDSADPEKQLESFVYSLLAHTMDEGRSSWSKRLVAREVAEPTFALDILVAHVVRPRAEHLQGIVRGFLGRGATDGDVRLYSESIAGQCLYYQFARPVLKHLVPGLDDGPAHTRQLTDHITRFSLAALYEYRRSNAA